MAVNGEESDLLEYTMKWTRLVNRGGLFEINETTYALFREIEMIVRKHLLVIFERTSPKTKEMLSSAVSSDEDIQFYWTILSVDIESEEQAIKLLTEIIGLWVTIRGFSIAGTWMENYQKVRKSVSHKSKALRKQLKKLSSTSDA